MSETYGVTTRQGFGRASRTRARRPLGASSVVIVGAILLILGALAGGVLGHFTAPSVVNSSGTEHLYLSIAYDPYTGLDQYFPANFSVPVNVPVIITITNYDNGTNLVPAAFDAVQGTVGGTETVTTAAASNVPVTSVPADQVAHTFTLITGPYDLNVPIPAAQDTTPTVVSFTVVFTSTGQFVWHCMAPCDDAAMATPGFMTGTVTVA